jgi:hypothetical protein
MNETMKITWLEISEMLGEPTPEELSVFLRAWQRAIQAEREACAKVADEQLMNTSVLMSMPPKSSAAWNIATAIRARGQA